MAFNSHANYHSFEDETNKILSSLAVLQEQYGAETCLIVSPGNRNQPQLSRVYASQKASLFLRDVIHTDAVHLAEKFEAYVASDGGVLPQATRMKQKEQIKIARDQILNGLVNLLREKNIREDRIPKSMNYKNYQTKIVEQYRVMLVGYPGDKGIINPGELDAIMLRELLHRLNDGRCHWSDNLEFCDLWDNFLNI